MTISFRLCSTVILAAALASSRLLAQGTPTQPELTLSACVARALLKNFDLEISIDSKEEVTAEAVERIATGCTKQSKWWLLIE